jgi:hypothetical protein
MHKHRSWQSQCNQEWEHVLQSSHTDDSSGKEIRGGGFAPPPHHTEYIASLQTATKGLCVDVDGDPRCDWVQAATKENALALAHKANHPPRNIRPNVLLHQINWSADSNAHACALPEGCMIPNKTSALVRAVEATIEREKRHAEDVHTPILVPGALLVSRTEIKCGQELFLNYGYATEHAQGVGWYHPCDESIY